jgi:hypothetical protein
MHERPTGTVTFLFSDIEGSTRLLQQLRGGYDEVLSTSRAHSLPAGPRRARWIDATITSPRKLSRVATSAGANETLPAW